MKIENYTLRRRTVESYEKGTRIRAEIQLTVPTTKLPPLIDLIVERQDILGKGIAYLHIDDCKSIIEVLTRAIEEAEKMNSNVHKYVALEKGND